MTAPSEIRRHLDRALGGDPRLAAVAVRELRDHALPWLEQRAVRLARNEGFSWGDLARLLGRSRQAVHRRHAAIDGTTQPLPCRPMRDDERFMAHWTEHLADVRRRREFDELERGDVVPW